MKNKFTDTVYESDKHTIGNNWDDLSVRYHYNFLENAIISELPYCRSVLDIGPGFGHWINFYQEVYNAYVNFIDTNHKMTRINENKFNITGYCKPIEDTIIDRQYDVINAIGVLHHIIKDSNLKKAIQNIFTMLNPGGTLFIGTRVDFIKPIDEGIRKFRTLSEWQLLLGDNVRIHRSDPPWYCYKHLDLLVYKRI